MHIEFFDPYPHEMLEPQLRSLVAGAKRLDAAVAFVTRGGAVVLREFISAQGPQNARLVASVRYPTDLVELIRLADAMPERVFIHTGFKTPEEDKADRGQFHSKVVLIEHDGNDRSLLIGSHNWTENALHGHNLEAGVIIRCQESDPIVGKVRQHIEACIHRSEQFDPTRLRFYQTIQRKLQTGPSGGETEDFPGFENIEALVIHAEDTTPDGLPDLLRLFIPIRERVSRDFFVNGQRVLLFLYPPGSLTGSEQPKMTPMLFDGEITMNNTVGDAPVDQRAANCLIGDLTQPKIDVLPSGSIPPQSGERFQVVIRLNGKGSQPVPLFHSAIQSPKLKLDVGFSVVDRDKGDDGYLAIRNKLSRQQDQVEQLAGVPRYEAPQHLIVRCIIRVPSADIYPPELIQQLNHAVWGLDFVEQTDVPEIRFEDPSPDRVLNRFVYLVNYQFTKEAHERVQHQKKLF